MKRYILTIFALLAISAASVSAQESGSRKLNKSRILSLVNELQSDAAASGVKSERETVRLPGIHVVSDNNLDFVSIGGIGVSLLKWGAKFSGDSDAKTAMASIDGLKRLIVLDYEDSDSALKERFNRKISRTLDGCEMLMEAKDEGETMRIFGSPSKDGSKISDIVMFSPENSALICFFGTIDADKLGKLVESAQKD